eukprot:jgi/Psemu1/53195/gm1.53195_g
MPFKKRASGNTVPPRKREKKSTLLVQQQREANKNDAADLGGTDVNPTGQESTVTGAAESTGRPSPRFIPQVNYAEESSDDEEEIDPERYQEPPLPVATTQKHVRISIAVIFELSHVFTEVLHCVENGTVYNGDGNYRCTQNVVATASLPVR